MQGIIIVIYDTRRTKTKALLGKKDIQVTELNLLSENALPAGWSGPWLVVNHVKLCTKTGDLVFA